MYFWFVAGREHLVQLETPGAADQKYNLAFQVVDNLPPSDPVQVTFNFLFGVNLNNAYFGNFNLYCYKELFSSMKAAKKSCYTE